MLGLEVPPFHPLPTSQDEFPATTPYPPLLSPSLPEWGELSTGNGKSGSSTVLQGGVLCACEGHIHPTSILCAPGSVGLKSKCKTTVTVGGSDCGRKEEISPCPLNKGPRVSALYWALQLCSGPASRGR